MLHFFIQTWKSVHTVFLRLQIDFNRWTKFGWKLEIWTKFWTKMVVLDGGKITFWTTYFLCPHASGIKSWNFPRCFVILQIKIIKSKKACMHCDCMSLSTDWVHQFEVSADSDKVSSEWIHSHECSFHMCHRECDETWWQLNRHCRQASLADVCSPVCPSPTPSHHNTTSLIIYKKVTTAVAAAAAFPHICTQYKSSK